MVMMTACVNYVLDSNVIISGFTRHFHPHLCPGFWQALPTIWGRLRASTKSRMSLLRRATQSLHGLRACPLLFFASTNEDDIMQAYSRVGKIVDDEQRYTRRAIDDYMSKADSWLVAHALANNATVVTEEPYDYKARKRIFIPNTCADVGIPCVDPFAMLRKLKIVFEWKNARHSGGTD